MPARAEPALAEEEQAEERRLEEEREHPLHRERLTDHAAGTTGELAQLVPNWNSIGIPVTTPMAKLMAKIRPQNRAASSYRASRVRERDAS